MLVLDPQQISIAAIIAALEGPVALTECSLDIEGLCDLEVSCPIKGNQRLINQVVHGALDKVMLSDLIRPMRLTAVRDSRGNLVPTISVAPGRMQ
jgi:DNA-binding IscR family transcriptional regulator